MEGNAKVQEYLALSGRYLQGAETLFREENFEPAMFDAIHATELAIKAALYTVSDEDIGTHRVASLFGKHFRDAAGPEFCREITRCLELYNFPRYPATEPPGKEMVAGIIATARKLVHEVAPAIIKMKTA